MMKQVRITALRKVQHDDLSTGVFYKLRDKERSKECAYVFNLIFRLPFRRGLVSAFREIYYSFSLGICRPFSPF